MTLRTAPRSPPALLRIGRSPRICIDADVDFAAAAVVGAVGVAILRHVDLYAVIVSVMLYRRFSRRRIDVERSNAAHPEARAGRLTTAL